MSVSIRRTDLCAFERHLLAVGRLAYLAVSIRRTDLCAFEPLSRMAVRCSIGSSFNPSNGFVCLRTPRPRAAD